MHIHVGLTALEGDVLDQRHRSWDIARGPGETLEAAMAMIDDLLVANGDSPLWGIAIGVPGPVDFATGRPVVPPIMPGWDGFDVRGAFERRYGAPAWVDNDVNLLAFSERARRREQRPDLLYCKVGTGIGVGLLSQGRIHRGANGAAGDIGHERVRDSEEACRCGKVGCLEAVAGGWALVRDAEAAMTAGTATTLRGGDGPLTAEQIARAAEDGDALAVSLVRSSARTVGAALASLVNMFNPAVIVLGGAVGAGAGDVFLAEVRHQIAELAQPLATRDLDVEQSLGDVREPLRGGAEMLREQLFDATFARWFTEGRPRLEVLRDRAARISA
ncbi:ROK family protein [Naasia aerilata]|uniref:ROK family protein n=1 Tax=Naasia aerilata TaxID=1162966 RepID=A0ABM8G8E7_9MICO|nr:ROK family protein [Naasia aerilata]BDZ44449.1 hypothetical protein GCM10025866_03580 [Naasia aerilata]